MPRREKSARRPGRNRNVHASRKAQLEPWLERARTFQGWNFEDIPTRALGPVPSWDYSAVVREQAAGRRSVLDLGTGGGEILAALRPSLPHRVLATEEWSVNAPIAHRRLSALGVGVVRCRSRFLPFAPAAFDLVIDRHEELDPAEVDRVLAPGGEFVTQQVGRHDWQELRRFIPRMTDFGDLRTEYARAFAERGFQVESSEAEGRVAYRSLGEFVFMLGVSPWTISCIDLSRDLEALLAFEAACSTQDGLVVTECRFLLVARKPK